MPLRPTKSQEKWLMKGLSQPGGKLSIFDENGKKISEKTIRSCIKNGWVKPWFKNPIKPNWVVCKLTERGRFLVKK